MTVTSQVERVMAMAVDEGVPVGALTGENRDVWTEVSEALDGERG